MSNFGASMEASMVEKKKRKATWKEGEASEIFLKEEREDLGLFIKKKKDFLFPFFSLSNATCPILSGAKRDPPFPLDVTSYSATRREKFDLLNAKILPRFVCCFSGSNSSRFSAPVGARFRK